MNIIKSTDFSHRWNIVLFLWELVCPFKEVIEQLSHPRLNLIYLLNRAPIAIFENRKQHRSCSLCWLVSIGHHILKLDFSALSRPCNHVVIPPPCPPAWPLKQKSTQMGLDKKILSNTELIRFICSVTRRRSKSDLRRRKMFMLFPDWNQTAGRAFMRFTLPSIQIKELVDKT